MGVKPHFLFSLGCYSKQAGNERYLIGDVPFFYTIHLPLPNHIYALVLVNRPNVSTKSERGQPVCRTFTQNFFVGEGSTQLPHPGSFHNNRPFSA